MGPQRRVFLDERGFTLPEMMVTILVMLVVFFALYGIFDASIRIFSFGNDKVEAVENARTGLARMEREIRAAYPYDKSNASTSDDHLFFGLSSPSVAAAPTYNSMTFRNELNGDAKPGCPISARDPRCEYVTYKLTASNSSASCTAASCTLRRLNSANPGLAGASLAESVTLDGLRFSYFKADGTAWAPGDGEGEIGRVQIRLSVSVKGRTQVLTTNVGLRNRS